MFKYLNVISSRVNVGFHLLDILKVFKSMSEENVKVYVTS